MPRDSRPIPDHESPVRRMVADARGHEFRPLGSLDEARAFDDGIAILEGDWGAQIYLTCPAALVRCSSESLRRLLLDIDSKCWACNEGDGAAIYFERKRPGSGICGVMGGGVVIAGLWLHKEVESFGIRAQIEAVLAGRQDRLEEGLR